MNSIIKSILNYSALSGIIHFILALLLIMVAMNPMGQSGWLIAWVPIVFMALACRNIRRDYFGGYISYWKVFRISFLTGGASAFLFGLLIYIYGAYFNSELLEIFKQEVFESLELTKSFIGDALYESGMDNLEKTTMFSAANSDFLNKILGTLLASFIIAAFFKNNKPEQDVA